jgi:hypothetical protein
MLGQYVKKVGQARRTPVQEIVLTRLSTLDVGHFVVVDEPLSVNMAVSLELEQLHGEDAVAAGSFISLVDLEILVDLGQNCHGFPAALLSWQQDRGPVRPFRHKLFQMERLTGATWLQEAFAVLDQNLRSAVAGSQSTS